VHADAFGTIDANTPSADKPLFGNVLPELERRRGARAVPWQ